jgi:Na+/H+ antiporter NhaC
MPFDFLIIYFVSLGICSLSTIYKTTCFKSMLCRQIIGNMFWSLVPVVNTLKAMLWLMSLIVDKLRAQRR